MSFSRLCPSYFKAILIWFIISFLMLSISNTKVFEKAAALNISFLAANIGTFVINMVFLITDMKLNHKGKFIISLGFTSTRKQYYIANVLYLLSSTLLVSAAQAAMFIISNLIIGHMYNLTVIDFLNFSIIAYLLFTLFESILNLGAIASYKYPYAWIIFLPLVFILDRYGKVSLVVKNFFNGKALNGMLTLTLISLIFIIAGWGILRKSDAY